ncbi:MAG: preprotein translocase subunit YajC [Treponema sp.]|nr:preprotein translocase subunit YajC [Treponema sp.]
MSFIPFLNGAATAPENVGGLGMLGSFAPLLIIIVIFYFFLIRPQSKKQKETEKMLKALKKGDNVVTIGGIHGVISSVKEKTVIVKVDDNCKIEFNRSAIASVEKSEAELAKEAEMAAALKEAKEAKKLAKKNKNADAVEAEAPAAEAEDTNK